MNKSTKNISVKTYLVGGFVRNLLLKKYLNLDLPPTDKDFLVIGADRNYMLSLGFIPIAKFFPIFLHPITKDEYALARTEKSIGVEHTAFKCNTKNISLKQDLLRRDITINAIALDVNNNQIIDPYHGLQDLKNKIIRHVSLAFTEDPLRVLRVARFASILVNFNIAKQTIKLMKQMADSKLLSTLSDHRVLTEITIASYYNFPIFLSTLALTNNLILISPYLGSIFKQNSNKIISYYNQLKSDLGLLPALALIVIVNNLIQSKQDNQILKQLPLIKDYFPFLLSTKIIRKLSIVQSFFALLVTTNKNCLTLLYISENLYKSEYSDVFTIIYNTSQKMLLHQHLSQLAVAVKHLLNISNNIAQEIKIHCYHNLNRQEIIAIKKKIVESYYQ